MVQFQRWIEEIRILIVSSVRHGSVQVSIPDKDSEDNFIKGKGDALIYALWVDEPWRKQGTARLLVKKAEREAKKIGCRKVCVEWDRRESESWVLKWYEQLGYKKIESGTYSTILVKKI